MRKKVRGLFHTNRPKLLWWTPALLREVRDGEIIYFEGADWNGRWELDERQPGRVRGRILWPWWDAKLVRKLENDGHYGGLQYEKPVEWYSGRCKVYRLIEE